jgi:arylsulfatase A-like enzyme
LAHDTLSTVKQMKAMWCRLAGLTLVATVACAAGKPPNILFIFSDDHAYQAISAYGDARKLVQTPNIDRIAADGMRFDRCLVTNSLCGPSRATVLTGKYSHRNGFYNNQGNRFDGSQPTFPQLLKTAGYQTAIVGKWHLVSDPTGFDYWHILPGQGVYYNPPMIRNGQPVKHEGYVTDIITDLSLDWLEQRDPAKPFLMMVHHKAPHGWWEPPAKYLGHDGDRQYPEPPTLFDDYDGNRGLPVRDQDQSLEKTLTSEVGLKLVPPPTLTAVQLAAWHAYYGPRNEKFRRQNPQGRDLVRWKYNRYLHDYLGSIKSVDDSVGRLLAYLAAAGLAQNTIVVYASDQGLYLGEHGWFDKRFIFEESLRTPLVMRWPGVTRPGTTSRDIVSNLDFAETFLDAAGVPVPAGMQGRSLRPIAAGRTPADWRRSFYYHYYEFPAPHRIRPHYGVVTDRHKLVHFYLPDVDEWQLYDRATDPIELRTKATEPAYATVVADLKRELTRLRAEVGDTTAPPREAYGRKAFPGEGRGG